MADFDQILPVTQVKKELLELLKDVQELKGNIGITKNGLPAGVLMSIDEYESLLATIEILANPKTMKALARARREHAAGQLLSHREVWK